MVEENKKSEEKEEQKKEIVEPKKPEENKKEIKQEKPKKEQAIVNGKNLPISTKDAMYICKFIKKKNIDNAIHELENVLKMKIAIPMKGEIPHRKNMMSGRYPLNATKEFIKILKSLNANCAVNEIEDPYIYSAIANKATRPYRRFGSRKFKRTHVTLIAKSLSKESLGKDNNKNKPKEKKK